MVAEGKKEKASKDRLRKKKKKTPSYAIHRLQSIGAKATPESSSNAQETAERTPRTEKRHENMGQAERNRPPGLHDLAVELALFHAAAGDRPYAFAGSPKLLPNTIKKSWGS